MLNIPVANMVITAMVLGLLLLLNTVLTIVCRRMEARRNKQAFNQYKQTRKCL